MFKGLFFLSFHTVELSNYNTLDIERETPTAPLITQAPTVSLITQVQNVSVYYNSGLLPDAILLTQCYYHRGTRSVKIP